MVNVLVHGTTSTCGIAFGGLPDDCIPDSTYRFEHDTFTPVCTNAASLCDGLQKLGKLKHLRLIAHSRGGLVARLAGLLPCGQGGEGRAD